MHGNEKPVKNKDLKKMFEEIAEKREIDRIFSFPKSEENRNTENRKDYKSINSFNAFSQNSIQKKIQKNPFFKYHPKEICDKITECIKTGDTFRLPGFGKRNLSINLEQEKINKQLYKKAENAIKIDLNFVIFL